VRLFLLFGEPGDGTAQGGIRLRDLSLSLKIKSRLPERSLWTVFSVLYHKPGGNTNLPQKRCAKAPWSWPDPPDLSDRS